MHSKVTKLNFKVISDNRGNLIALEKGKGIPFEPKRIYYIYNTKKDQARGFHAHINLSQVLVATSGTVKIKCLYKNRVETFILDNPGEGLLIEGLVWREMSEFSNDAVLMVIASDVYDESDYIRKFADFLNLEKLKR